MEPFKLSLGKFLEKNPEAVLDDTFITKTINSVASSIFSFHTVGLPILILNPDLIVVNKLNESKLVFLSFWPLDQEITNYMIGLQKQEEAS